MSHIVFHKCMLCDCLFYAGKKTTYCTKCIPKCAFGGSYPKSISPDYFAAIDERRAKERERWHARMANPMFREKERLRSLARLKMDKKYAKEKKYG